MINNYNNTGSILRYPSMLPLHIEISANKKALKYRETDKINFEKKVVYFESTKADALRIGMHKLEKRLQAFVPNTVMQYRESSLCDISNMLNRGHFWYGQKARKIIGEKNQCHSNSIELYELNKDDFDIKLETGYSLSKNGLWYQHTWLVLSTYEKGKTLYEIIETTPSPRIAYYGFTLTNEEAVRFAENNRNT